MESVRTCFETCANLCQFRTWLIGVSFVCFFTANLNFAVFIWLIAAKHLSKDLQGFLAAKVVAFYLLGCAGLIVAWRPNDLVGYAVPVLAGLGAVFSFAFFIIETHEVLSEEKSSMAFYCFLSVDFAMSLLVLAFLTAIWVFFKYKIKRDAAEEEEKSQNTAPKKYEFLS